jgi:hypothetical protein
MAAPGEQMASGGSVPAHETDSMEQVSYALTNLSFLDNLPDNTRQEVLNT